MHQQASPVSGRAPNEAGFSLMEMLVSMAVLLIVANLVFTGVLRLTNVNRSVHNRSEMHSGVRNATELLQQEVGQAGRIALPAPVTLAGNAPAGAATVGVTSAAGMFPGEFLVVGVGALQETIAVTAVNTAATPDTITATFANAHPAGTPVLVFGGFASGIVPTTTANGSSGTVLKIFGDVNGTGEMQYVEYTCDLDAGNLYRNAMEFDAANKPALTVGHVLLDNVRPNPDNTPCFTYQQQTVAGVTFVVQVAITLTVETEDPDPITGLFQTETKALLNVAPRNVFHVWQLASLNIANRIQPMPPTVAALLPDQGA
jgi:prepilin-type N-terminal cleavage/methylation domain-containing protein